MDWKKSSIFICFLAIGGCFTETAAGESLEQAWSEAISVSRQLQAADCDIQSSQFDRRAATSARLPQVELESSYTALNEKPRLKTDLSSLTSPLGLPGQMEIPLADKQFGTAGVGLSVPLYTGGKITQLETAADSMISASQSGKRSTLADLKRSIVIAYIQVLRMEKLKQVAQSAKTSLDGHLSDVENLLNQGLTTRTAFLSAQVAQSNAVQNLTRVQYGLATSKSAYNRLLWRPMDDPVELAEIDFPPVSSALVQLLTIAQKFRPELAQLTAQSKALAAQAESVKAERRPQIAAVASYNYVQDSYLTPNDYAQASVVATWTPFDPVNKNKEQSVRWKAVKAARMQEEVSNGIRLQVQKAYNDYQTAIHNITSAKLAVKQSQENLTLTRDQFKEGITTYTEVLDAQTLWTQSNTNLANAVYDAMQASYELLYATGQL